MSDERTTGIWCASSSTWARRPLRRGWECLRVGLQWRADTLSGSGVPFAGGARHAASLWGRPEEHRTKAEAGAVAGGPRRGALRHPLPSVSAPTSCVTPRATRPRGGSRSRCPLRPPGPRFRPHLRRPPRRVPGSASREAPSTSCVSAPRLRALQRSPPRSRQARTAGRRQARALRAEARGSRRVLVCSCARVLLCV